MLSLVSDELGRYRCERRVKIGNHTLDRTADRFQCRSGQAATLRVPHGLELPLPRHQTSQRHVFPVPRPQLAGLEPVAAIVTQQPRVDPIGFCLDPLRLAEGFHALRVNDGPRDGPVRQCCFQVSLPAASALEHHDIPGRVKMLDQRGNAGRVVVVPLHTVTTFDRCIEIRFADVDTNNLLAVHTDLHHP